MSLMVYDYKQNGYSCQKPLFSWMIEQMQNVTHLPAYFVRETQHDIVDIRPCCKRCIVYQVLLFGVHGKIVVCYKNKTIKNATSH